jgi:hypothetical protein
MNDILGNVYNVKIYSLIIILVSMFNAGNCVEHIQLNYMLVYV